MDRGAWRARVHGVEKSWTQLKQFSTQRERKSVILLKIRLFIEAQITFSTIYCCFCSITVLSDSSWRHGQQHARLPCPSLSLQYLQNAQIYCYNKPKCTLALNPVGLVCLGFPSFLSQQAFCETVSDTLCYYPTIPVLSDEWVSFSNTIENSQE